MDSIVAAAPAPTAEPDVPRLLRMQAEGRHRNVLREVEPLLEAGPESRELLLIKADSLRHLLRIPEALDTLERLERSHPRFSRLHEQRGLCHVALKEAPAAIEALLRAVNINPALPMSWRMLEGLYRLTGDPEKASTAAAHVATLKRLPPEVVSATSLFADGELTAAEDLIRAFLLRHGDQPDAMRLLAKIGIAHDVLDDAEVLLEAALALRPDFRAARYDYADVLLKRRKFLQGREQVDQLLALDPGNLDYRALAATGAAGLGEHERAIALYRQMLAEAPRSPDIHLWLGHALKTIGRLPEAIEAYRMAAALRPDFGDAYWSLANLKTYRFAEDDIARMRAEEASPGTASEDRFHLCFALGKALEDKGRAAESWRYYEQGNAQKLAQGRYRPEAIEATARKQTELCTRDFFASRAGWGDPRPDPIFIVGLPRSGSTLLEQILASHSRVEGTHELADIQRIVMELRGRDPDRPRYPDRLAELTGEEFRRYGETYLADTQVYRSGKPFFIDKMPNNFLHVGLIHLMLPNAGIIDARREPMSCCFSNLKQLFAQGQEFTYSIDNIARYYRTYLALMRHWDEALPGRVLRVQHEDVVDDLEGSVRRMLDYCGLAFEPACVAFHATERSVRTPSSEQVRQPIFRDGLDQWRNYETWLEPLKGALGDALERYRD